MSVRVNVREGDGPLRRWDDWSQAPGQADPACRCDPEQAVCCKVRGRRSTACVSWQRLVAGDLRGPSSGPGRFTCQSDSSPVTVPWASDGERFGTRW